MVTRGRRAPHHTSSSNKILLQAFALLFLVLQVLAASQEPQQPLEEQQLSSSEESQPDTYAQGQALYSQAVDLLSNVRAQSVSVTYTPSTSLLKPDSYTPLLDLIEQANGPLAVAVRFTRRLLYGSQSSSSRTATPPAEMAEQEDHHHWSLRGLVSRFTGTHQLLGDYYRPNNEHSKSSRTRRILDNLAAGATFSKAEIKLSLEQVSHLLSQAGSLGYDPAWQMLGDMNFWGQYGKEQNFSQAFAAYKAWADRTGDPDAQYMVAFLKGTGLYKGLYQEGDQAAALLYYTFAAFGHSTPAEITAGYRHWVGIGTPQSCSEALPFYKAAADKAMERFYSGPPGGLPLPPIKTRLSDLDGGVYGPGASVASTGLNALKSPASSYSSAGGHIHNPSTEAEWEDVLEFYTFHADRGVADFMYRLARIYYHGFGSAGAVSKRRRAFVQAHPNRHHGLDETGGRDLNKALKWFSRIARAVWPRDPAAALKKPTAEGSTVGAYDIHKDPRATKDEHLNMVAGLAAGFLGRMHLRGEGVPQDFGKAFLWFSRGLAQGDTYAKNGLGMMYRDGLGVKKDRNKALSYFQAASGEALPENGVNMGRTEAHVNLGRMYLDAGDKQTASQYFELALKHADHFQSLYYLAEMNAHAVARPDLCPVAVSYYKMVVERGDWEHEIWWDAERAWVAGDYSKALLGYWMMAERGYEPAQNNVAYILDKQKSMMSLPGALKSLSAQPSEPVSPEDNSTQRLALTHWTRSAAQDNIDALVKMGDYYLDGIGTVNSRPQMSKAAACYQTAASTHVSALALWNLGWMHETGQGVKKDFHLAKRYYDLAYQTNREAYLPVTLSLFRLHLRSVYEALTSGTTDSLIVHSPFAAPPDTDSAVASGKPFKAILRDFLAKVFTLRFHEALAEIFAGLPPSQHGYQTEQRHTDPERLRERQQALAADEDPVQWARQAREREQLEEDPDEEWESLGLGGRDSDVLESVGIVALIVSVGFLLYYRGIRVEATRQMAEAVRRRQEDEARQEARNDQDRAEEDRRQREAEQAAR